MTRIEHLAYSRTAVSRIQFFFLLAAIATAYPVVFVAQGTATSADHALLAISIVSVTLSWMSRVIAWTIRDGRPFAGEAGAAKSQ